MTSQLVADPLARRQEWRHHLHRHPETAFAETATAAYLGGILAGLGYEVEHGLGGTGLVASLRRGDGIRSIGLRADMDALPITEAPGRVHGSRNPGAMHACGHDGHLAMALGAAALLCRRCSRSAFVRSARAWRQRTARRPR